MVDQERAKRFWVNTIRCEVVQDERYGVERWLEVRLPDGVVLVLERHEGPDASASAGQPPFGRWALEGNDIPRRDGVAEGLGAGMEHHEA